MTTNQTGSKIWAAGLAGLACVGVAGAFVAKSASATEPSEPLSAPVTSEYTIEQLDAYKAELDAQAQKLKDYEAELIKLSKRISAEAKASTGGGPSGGSVSSAGTGDVARPDAAPPPIVKPQPAPAPDANSQPSG